MRAAPLILGLALASFLGGCAAFKPRPADPGLFMLAPESADVELSVTQILKFSKAGKAFEALAVLELSREMLSIAALGPMGNRVLGIRWDGKKLEHERDPSIPTELPVELIIRDIQLALWPADAVRSAVTAKGWSLEDRGLSRLLSKNGELVVRIDYGPGDRWHSTIRFNHLSLGYQLEIQAVKEDEP